MPRPEFKTYADSEGPMRCVRIYVAEQTPDTTLIYFEAGASSVMRTDDFNARYTLLAPV